MPTFKKSMALVLLLSVFCMPVFQAEAQVSSDALVITAMTGLSALYGRQLKDFMSRSDDPADHKKQYLYLCALDHMDSDVQLAASNNSLISAPEQSMGVDILTHSASAETTFIRASVNNFGVLVLTDMDSSEGIFFVDAGNLQIIDQSNPEPFPEIERINLSRSGVNGKQCLKFTSHQNDAHEMTERIISIEDIHQHRFAFVLEKDKSGYLIITVYSPEKGYLSRRFLIATHIHEFQPEGIRLKAVMLQFHNVVTDVEKQCAGDRAKTRELSSRTVADLLQALFLREVDYNSHLMAGAGAQLHVQNTALGCIRSGDVQHGRNGLVYPDPPGIHEGMMRSGGSGGGHGSHGSSSHSSGGKHSGKGRTHRKKVEGQDHFSSLREQSGSRPLGAWRVEDQASRGGRSGGAVHKFVGQSKPVCEVRPMLDSHASEAHKTCHEVERELMAGFSDLKIDSTKASEREGRELEDVWESEDDLGLSSSEEPESKLTTTASSEGAIGLEPVTKLLKEEQTKGKQEVVQFGGHPGGREATGKLPGEVSKAAIKNRKKRANRKAKKEQKKLESDSLIHKTALSSEREDALLRRIKDADDNQSRLAQSLINLKNSQGMNFGEIQQFFIGMMDKGDIDLVVLSVLLTELDGMFPATTDVQNR